MQSVHDDKLPDETDTIDQRCRHTSDQNIFIITICDRIIDYYRWLVLMYGGICTKTITLVRRSQTHLERNEGFDLPIIANLKSTPNICRFLPDNLVVLGWAHTKFLHLLQVLA
jgi:hypothetical protein